MDTDTEEIIMDIPTVKNGRSFFQAVCIGYMFSFHASMSEVFGLLNKRFQKMGAQ